MEQTIQYQKLQDKPKAQVVTTKLTPIFKKGETKSGMISPKNTTLMPGLKAALGKPNNKPKEITKKSV